MADEKQNNNTTEDESEKTWKDVNLTPEFPLTSLVQFLNILNQRMSTIEDIIIIKDENGKEMSLSEKYKEDAKANKDTRTEGK